MPIVDANVDAYMRSLVNPPDDVVAEMEQLAAEKSFPIIGPLSGRVLYQTALASRAKRVYELGSGFGYSTYWFCKAVGPQGCVVHTDGDENNTAMAKEFLGRAGYLNRVEFHTGWAQEFLRADDREWDIIYMDVDKDGYPECWELAVERVKSGGWIIADNVLWSGRVAEENPDETTKAILELNRLAYSDSRFVTTIHPARDGLLMALRR